MSVQEVCDNGAARAVRGGRTFAPHLPLTSVVLRGLTSSSSDLWQRFPQPFLLSAASTFAFSSFASPPC